MVLLADDVPAVRIALQHHLLHLCSTQWSEFKFEFVAASTGEKCIELIMGADGKGGTVHADCVIMDQYMYSAGGKLLGSEAVQLLRNYGFQGFVIGCSGNIECEQLFEAAGASCFWFKPGD